MFLSKKAIATGTAVLALIVTLQAAVRVDASQGRAVEGAFIMARGGNSALYIWNATPYVAQLVTDKEFGAQAMRDIESTSIQALAEKTKSSHAANVSVRIVYERTGSVSPVYGTATFEGVETVGTLSAKRENLQKNAAAWASAILAGAMPPDLDVHITGQLPPR